MEHLIEEKDGFKVVGLAVDSDFVNAGKEIPPIWADFLKRYKEIKNGIGGMKNYGVCFDIDEGRFRYIACEEVSEFEDLPKDMVMADVEPSKYAVFVHKGKLEKLGETYEKIINFVKEKGMKRKPFWVEFYDKRYKGDKEESEFEIWIAIE